MKTLKFLLVILSLVNLNMLNAQTAADGLKYLENENFTAATKTFKDLAAKEPTNPIYSYYLGEVSYKTEDFAGAEKFYNEGLKISPKCAECSIGIAKLKLDQGKAVEATPIFDAVLKNNKKSAPIIALVGKAFLTSKIPNALKAIEYLGRSRDMAPKVANTLSMLGDAYKLNNDLGNAMTQYETSVELDPKNLEAVMSQARIWASAKQAELAIKKLEEALKLNPDYAPAYKDLYELYIRERKFEKVTPLLNKYVSLVGTDIDARVRLVKFLCFQAKDYARAISEGQKLLSTNPEQYTVHRWMAWAAAELEKYQDSYDSSMNLFKAAKADPSRKLFQSDSAYYAKAVFAIGKLDEAEVIYDKMIQANPSITLETYDKFAKSYYAQKNYEKTIAFYNKKNAIKPLSNSDLFYLALSQYNTNKFEEADSSFSRMLAIAPNYLPGWNYKIRIAELKDTVPTARTWTSKPFHDKFIEFASVDPVKNKANLVRSYNYLAYYYSQNNDFEGAKSTYAKLLEMDPTNANATVWTDNLKALNNNPPPKKTN